MNINPLEEHSFDTFSSIEHRFDKPIPEWHEEAVQYLRGNKDRGDFGLYLYFYIRENPSITEVINIGTARGYSAICIAHALSENDGPGRVHTIDIRDPDKKRQWHGETHAPTDGLKNESRSMRDLIKQFSPDDNSATINIRTGNSTDLLSEMDCNPDLVFIDGRHTYEHVKSELELIGKLADPPVTYVFDDCYLFSDDAVFRPFDSSLGYVLDDIPLFRNYIQRLRRYEISKRPFPGVTKAVTEWWESEELEGEIVYDEQHAPITVAHEK
jgi:hypothetical protein